MSRPFRIALAQCESVVGTEDFDPRPTNLARARRAVSEAADNGADIVLLGEMFLTGYKTDEWNRRWALDLTDADPTLGAVAAFAREFSLLIMIGTATHDLVDANVVHNTAVLIGADGIIDSYDKLHVAYITVPTGELVDEGLWFTAGNKAPVWDSPLGQIGPQICYDSSFPELSRAQTIQGAEVLLNISASAVGFEEHWNHNRATRAMENAAYYAVCSIVGEQRGDQFFGLSAVIDPMGKVLVEARAGVEDLVFADIDPQEALDTRKRMNTLPARRTDVYGDLLTANDKKES
jgi:predicted amidohydrolase